MPALETMESILMALWRASWQASLLILLVLLVQVTMRRWLSPAWRSALWLLVVVRLVLPVTPSSAWSLFNLTSHLDTHRATALDPAALIEPKAHRSAGLRHGDVERAHPFPHVQSPVDTEIEMLPHDASLHLESNDPVPGTASVLPTPAAAVLDSRGSWLPILFWIWLAGVVILSARIVCGALLLSRHLRRASSVTNRGTLELIEECRQMIGTRRTPLLLETDAVDSPALFGLLRPKLLLPTGLLARLSQDELRHVFLHELVHLRRHDLLLNWISTLLQILHWFNPVVWFGFARMRADRELACDALALACAESVDRAAYGATLLKLVSDLTPTRPIAGLVGISEGKSHLKRRIQTIAAFRKPTWRSALAGAAVLLLLAAVSLTDARAHRDVGEPDAPMDVVPQQVDSSGPSSTAVGAKPAPATQPQPVSSVGGETSAATEGNALPSPNPLASTNLTVIGPGRQRIQSLLQQIVLNEFECDGIALPDILKYLGDVARQFDSEQQGINFLIHPNLVITGDPPLVDPPTAQAIPSLQAEPMATNNVIVRIVPAMRNVRLGDVLEAITHGTDKPIRYMIEEYGVIFTPKPPYDSVGLETRIFKVNADMLLNELLRVGENVDAINEGIDEIDFSAGLKLDDRVATFPSDDHLSTGNTDTLSGITSMNLQSHKRAALRQFFLAAGVNLEPPNQIYFGVRRGMLMVRATTPELDALHQAIEDIGALTKPSPRISIEVRLIELTRTNLIGGGSDWFLGNTAASPVGAGVFPGGMGAQVQAPSQIPPAAPYQMSPTTVSWRLSGILTERQFPMVLSALERRPGAKITSIPPVTTSSGRSTRITQVMQDGDEIAFDCLAVVSSDGYTVEFEVARIDATLSGTVRTGTAPETVSNGHDTSKERAVVWDGQTIILNHLAYTGDSESEDVNTPAIRNVILCLTPTIVDPTGSPVHPRDTRPFDPGTVPPQTPQ